MTKPKYRRLTYDDRRVIENMCKAKKNAIGDSKCDRSIAIYHIPRIIAQ